jgi:O-antigen/teichoic acid export membrane protein
LRKECRRLGIPVTLRGSRREWGILWTFSLPAVLAGSPIGPVNWLCSALLVNQPNGYDEMGVFNAANQWYTMLLFLPVLLAGVVLPILSERLGQKDTQQSLKTMVLAIKLNIVVVLPLIVVASVASPYIMGLYGPGFRSAWPTLIIVLLTTGLLTVQTPVAQILTASGRMWIGFVMNIGWALVFVTASMLLVHQGALGLATARLISYAAHAAWTLGFAIWLLRGTHRPDGAPCAYSSAL